MDAHSTSKSRLLASDYFSENGVSNSGQINDNVDYAFMKIFSMFRGTSILPKIIMR